MSDLLDRSITASLASMVADAPPAGPMPDDHVVERTPDRRHRPWLVAAAAAVVVVGVAGIVAVAARGHDRSTPAAASTPPPVSARPPGIFPSGGARGAIAAGHATPLDAVAAYLYAITDPARLPADYRVTASVADPQEVGTEDPDHVVVAIALRTDDDTGDGHVWVQRLRDEPAVWQVTAAAVIGDETRDVQIVDGTLTGSIATAAGGSTTLYAYDLASGDLLDATTVSGVEPADGEDPAPISFRLDVGATTEVGLRYWNTVAPAGGYQFANFADRVVGIGGRGGETAAIAPDVTTPTASPATAVASTPSAPDVTTAPSTAAASAVPAAPGDGDPTAYPTLDDVPAGLTATAYTLRTAAEDPWTEALVGRVVDGTATDMVAISVSAAPYDINPRVGHPPTSAEVFGQPAAVYDAGTAPGGTPLVHVVWGTGPHFLASGADPLAFLAAADPSTLQATVAAGDQAPTLTIGALPAGFDILTSPQPLGHETLAATLSIGQDNFDLSVSSRDFLVSMGQAGPLRSVDVGGGAAWTFASSTMSHDVAWAVDDHTYAYLKVNDGTDLDDALALASAFDFVDWATFAGRYGIQPPEVPAATTVPGG